MIFHHAHMLYAKYPHYPNMPQQQSRRPRQPPPPRVIIALDLDCFYASVAIRAHPHLHDKPVAILQKHLCVTTNYVARRLANGGIPKMTPLSTALRRCPDLVTIDGSDLTPFREASTEVLTAIRAFLASHRAHNAACPIQRHGLDEFFIDITLLVAASIPGSAFRFDGDVVGNADDDLRRTLMVASQLTHELRQEVTRITRLTLSAGISNSWLLAKLAVNMRKPDGQTVFLPCRAAEHIAQLSPRCIPGYGSGVDEKVCRWVAENASSKPVATVADLLALFPGRQGVTAFGNVIGNEATAERLLDMCRGIDAREVIDTGDAPKSISAEDSCRNCVDMTDVRRRLTVQSSRLVKRLRSDGQNYIRHPKSLTVTYRFRGDGFVGTSRTVPMPMEIVSVCRSAKVGAEEVAVSAIVRAALKVLKDHANVFQGATFDLTLLSLGAANFTDRVLERDDASMRKISSFFTPLASGKKQDHRLSQQTISHVADHPSSCVKESASKSKVAVKRKMQHVSTVVEDVPTCPVCEKQLTKNNVLVNMHIDRCLESSGVKQKRKKQCTSNSHIQKLDSFFRKS